MPQIFKAEQSILCKSDEPWSLQVQQHALFAQGQAGWALRILWKCQNLQELYAGTFS